MSTEAATTAQWARNTQLARDAFRRRGYDPDQEPLRSRLERTRFDVDAHGREEIRVAGDGVDLIAEFVELVTRGDAPPKKDYRAIKAKVATEGAAADRLKEKHRKLGLA